MGKISTKINLEITKIEDTELQNKIQSLKPAIRLFCKIKFSEIASPRDAIIDTGAHISVLPLQTWKQIKTDIKAEHFMKGIIPDKHIPVKVGVVKGILIDNEGNESKEITFLSYLALTNNVPLILGMRDILEKFDLHMIISKNKAYLEEL